MELQTQRQTESELANMKITTLGNRIVDLERDVYSVNELAKQTQVTLHASVIVRFKDEITCFNES
jgi:hypothetical protein